MDKEFAGKKLYYKEEKIGKIIEIRKDPFKGEKDLAIIEVGKNNYKATPVPLLKPVSDRYEFSGTRNKFESFPKMSLKDFEDNAKLKETLTEHYGQPDSWSKQVDIKNGEDQEYMGSSQITNQAPPGNTAIGDELDYDNIKHDNDKKDS